MWCCWILAAIIYKDYVYYIVADVPFPLHLLPIVLWVRQHGGDVKHDLMAFIDSVYWMFTRHIACNNTDTPKYWKPFVICTQFDIVNRVSYICGFIVLLLIIVEFREFWQKKLINYTVYSCVCIEKYLRWCDYLLHPIRLCTCPNLSDVFFPQEGIRIRRSLRYRILRIKYRISSRHIENKKHQETNELIF